MAITLGPEGRQGLKTVDVERVAALIREAAKEFILPRFRRLLDHEISTKTGPRDLVTQADIDVENHLSRILPDILPGSLVLGEEGVAGGTVGIDLLQDRGSDLWILDPVDGTYNFVHGREEFAVMMALVRGGETRMAWIYDVPADRMTAAEAGSGSFTEGGRLSVRPETQESEMTGFVSSRFFPKPMQERIAQGRALFKNAIPLGSAAHEYLRVADGRAQFSIYSRLKPWDHLPGALIVREAGGHVAKWDGRPYVPQDHDAGLIAAASPEIWENVKAIFTGAPFASV